MNDITSNFENEITFYCKVDTHRAVKDYLQGGRCVRLFAVTQRDFSADALSGGVTTFTIDIDFWIFCALDRGVDDWRQVSLETRKQIEERDADIGLASAWLRLEVAYLPRAKNYLYRTFSDDVPRFFDIVSLQTLSAGPEIPAPPIARFAVTATHNVEEAWPFDRREASDRRFVFDTFHVGQGMCSLVHDGSDGIVLDMGAGKPVTRERYQLKLINNDLSIKTSQMKRLLLVISHADSDHWRIIGWDPALLNQIEAIYAPVGAISLALRDKAVSKKVYGLGNTTWHLNPSTTLRFWRSEPSHNDENGKCLVAVFDRAGDRVLAPGDYVYKRFKSDTNSGINTLHHASYAAVVVPHHGDEASGHDVVSPTGVARAFFSAGTHKSWGHPTVHSLTAHDSANFNNISDPHEPNIVSINLI